MKIHKIYNLFKIQKKNLNLKFFKVSQLEVFVIIKNLYSFVPLLKNKKVKINQLTGEKAHRSHEQAHKRKHEQNRQLEQDI